MSFHGVDILTMILKSKFSSKIEKDCLTQEHQGQIQPWLPQGSQHLWGFQTTVGGKFALILMV